MQTLYQEYIKAFYSLFNEYNNLGYAGNKKTMRYTLQLRTGRYIPERYIDFSLKVFREIGLIEKSIVSCTDSKYRIMKIGEMVFKGAKSIWPKVEMPENVLNEKLESLEHLFENYIIETRPLITKEELDIFEEVYTEKYNEAREILGNLTGNLFSSDLIRPYGMWINDISPDYFQEELFKIKGYNKTYYLNYKERWELNKKNYELSIQSRENQRNELLQRYISVLKSISSLVDKVIMENGDVLCIFYSSTNQSDSYLWYPSPGIVSGEIRIKEIQYYEEKCSLIIKNDNINLTLDPFAFKVKDSCIALYNGGSTVDFGFELGNLNNEQKEHLEYLKYLIKKHDDIYLEMQYN